MMWLSTFYIFSTLSFKEFLNFSSMFESNLITNFMYLISASFMIMYKNMNFNHSSPHEKKMNLTIFLLILTFSNLSFFTTMMMVMIMSIELTIYPMMKMFLNQSKDSDKLSSMTFMFNINISGSILFLFSMTKVLLSLNTMLILFNMHLNKDFLVSIFFCLMLLTKIPMIFMQFWLSKAHVSASGACSMLLASVMLKLGSYGMMKFWCLMKMNWLLVQSLMYSLCVMGMIMFSLMMIRYTDLKLLVAYSSITHMSLVIPFTMKFNTSGMTSSIFTLVSHGLISSMFFMLVTMMYENTMSRSIDTNKSLHSFNKTFPLMMFVMVFINMGMPPLINFYTEMIFLHLALKISYLLMVLISLSMLLMIIFNMMVVLYLNYGKKILTVNKNINLKMIKLSSTTLFMLIILPFCLS